MTIRPLHDRLVVRSLAAATKTSSGLYIPDAAQEKPLEGEVLAAGRGKRDNAGIVQPLDVHVGDRILYGRFSGSEVEVDGEKLLIMREEDVFAVIEVAKLSAAGQVVEMPGA